MPASLPGPQKPEVDRSSPYSEPSLTMGPLRPAVLHSATTRASDCSGLPNDWVLSANRASGYRHQASGKARSDPLPRERERPDSSRLTRCENHRRKGMRRAGSWMTRPSDFVLGVALPCYARITKVIIFPSLGYPCTHTSSFPFRDSLTLWPHAARLLRLPWLAAGGIALPALAGATVLKPSRWE